MSHKQLRNHKSQENTLVEISRFEPAEGVAEYHVVIHVTQPSLTYQEQLDTLLDTYYQLLENELKGTVAVFKRYFLSDAANQADWLAVQVPESSVCACSIVEQPPLNGTKIALWVYLQSGVQCRALESGLFEVAHGAYRHLWGGSACNRAANSEYQTRLLLNDYILQLIAQGGHLAENCIRTWFFVQNVDVNYAGVVKGRKEEFVRLGLTEKTHYLASTGIQGQIADSRSLVLLDAYAVDGLQAEQIRFLHAPEYLNPTYEYGVTFERGTAVEYGDRKHIFISGTASIDNRGEVVYPGNIAGQTRRMLLNIEALLKEAGSSLADLAKMIVYLRDIADYPIVRDLMEQQFPDVPKVIVLAPVYRPGWLIETECIAIKAGGNPEFRNL